MCWSLIGILIVKMIENRLAISADEDTKEYMKNVGEMMQRIEQTGQEAAERSKSQAEEVENSKKIYHSSEVIESCGVAFERRGLYAYQSMHVNY